MNGKVLKLVCLLAVCSFLFACGGKPSTKDAKKALQDAWGEIGTVVAVKKLNGWFKDNSKNVYVMEVSYKLKLSEKARRILRSPSDIESIFAMPLYAICTDGDKLLDVCKTKARLVFHKTEKGWVLDKNSSKFINPAG